MMQPQGDKVENKPGTSAAQEFVPVGPRSLTSKAGRKPYKFVEPPGVSEWVFSFAKKCLVCGLVYGFGYLQLSVGWLVGPIILLVVRDQWRRHNDAQRALATASARGDEREIVLARLGDNLPSWVIFPDVERAEWLNLILKQLWPKINNYTFDLVRDSIEPGLRDTLATSYKMNSFRFEKIILGDTPLRVRGVKVYDEKKTDRGEIIMDLDVIYAGDCDFRFSVSKIRAGIKDLHLSGTLRLVMKPLIDQIPLIGGIQYFFLNPPNLDFDLVGAADVFDMPGLSDLIRRIVQEQISTMCVLPNKMFIPLSEHVNVNETLISRPQGIVRVCALEAKNLMAKDVGVLGTGKSDPYVVLSVGAQQLKSKVINNNLNPKWEFWCEMMVEELGQTLNVVLYDHDDAPRADEFLGRTKVDLSLVAREGTMDVWLELEDIKHGAVHLKLMWLGLSSNPAELKTSMMESQSYGLSSCLLTVRLDSATNLPLVREGSKPDAQVILSIGKTQFTSSTKEKTVDPVFEESFNFLVRSPLTDTLLLKVVDKKSGADLGGIKQSLDLVYHRPNMKMEKQNFALSIKSEAKVILTMEIKVLKHGPAKALEIEEDHHTAPYQESSEPKASDNVGEAEVSQPKPKPVETNTGGSGQSSSSGQGTSSGPETSSSTQPASALETRKEGLEPQVSQTEVSTLLRNISVEPKDDSNMKIRLTIRYSQTKHELVVVVHTVTNLPIEKEELPDPYVKLYILPEKSKKHKTDSKKDQCDPVYDEKFEFPMIDLRGKTLHVQVLDKKFIRSSSRLGEVYVALDDFMLGNVVTSWYPLSA